MQGYIVSFQDGLLKVSLAGTDQNAQKKIKGNITDHVLIAEELGQLILENFGSNSAKLPLNFLASLDNIHLNFLTVNKNSGEMELYSLAKEKLISLGIDVEGLYLSYQKIAPFVYQLVAIKKEVLEAYIEIASD